MSINTINIDILSTSLSKLRTNMKYEWL